MVAKLISEPSFMWTGMPMQNAIYNTRIVAQMHDAMRRGVWWE